MKHKKPKPKARNRAKAKPKAKVKGSVVRKRIYCQSCRRCKGHGPYLYRVWREGKKVRWKYLGPARR